MDFLMYVLCRQHEDAWLLLAISMELILIPNCSLLYLYSNDMLFEKCSHEEKKRVVYSSKYLIVIKTGLFDCFWTLFQSGNNKKWT